MNLIRGELIGPDWSVVLFDYEVVRGFCSLPGTVGKLHVFMELIEREA